MSDGGRLAGATRRIESSLAGMSSLKRAIVGLAACVLLAVLVLGLLFPGSQAGTLLWVLTADSTVAATLRLSVPIAFAAVGGIFAEKSGVINIGLEGLLIISAFVGIWATDVAGTAWAGIVGGVVASTLLAALFAVVCIEFRADQIIAGLAVWLIALGLAPFAASVVYGSTNTDNVASFGNLPDLGIPVVSDGVTATLPVLDQALVDLPIVGPFFDASPFVYLMFAAVAASWFVLYRTAFGRWVRASGENPEALDTAGVSVHRVRYTAVLLSGVLAGLGGVALSLSIGQFTGNGPTMVNGKGFIAIVAYLFGNYNPVGALLSTMLFAGLEGVQLTLQALDVFAVPRQLVRTIPYVAVIIVLAVFGRTRIPSAAGDHYETGEDE